MGKAPLHKYVEKDVIFVAFLPKKGYIYSGLWGKSAHCYLPLGNPGPFLFKNSLSFKTSFISFRLKTKYFVPAFCSRIQHFWPINIFAVI